MRTNRFTRLSRLLLGASLLSCISVPVAAAQDNPWSFSAGVDYTSGDYGEAQDTTIYQIPLTAAYRGNNWSFAITVPYVDLEGSGNIIPGAAGGVGGGGAGGAAAGLGIGGGGIDLGISLPGQSPSPAPVPPPVPTTIQEQGLGDATLSLSFAPFRHESGGGLTIGAGARLPTGDEDKSLGAGEVIGSLGANYALPLTDSFSLYGGVGYAHGFESEEGGVFGGIGAQIQASSHFLIGAGVDWSESTVSGTEDATSATLYTGYDLTSRTRLVAYASGGLTDTSPDLGAGLRLIFRP